MDGPILKVVILNSLIWAHLDTSALQTHIQHLMCYWVLMLAHILLMVPPVHGYVVVNLLFGSVQPPNLHEIADKHVHPKSYQAMILGSSRQV